MTRSASRTLALTALALGAAIALAGCAGDPGPVDQHVTVSYLATADATEPTVVEVTVPALTCSEINDLSYFSAASAEGKTGDAGLLTARTGDDTVQSLVSVRVDTDLVFLGTEGVEAGDELVVFDGAGRINEVTFDGDERTIVGVVDPAATITGTIECTENR
jgi:hypothetical protein